MQVLGYLSHAAAVLFFCVLPCISDAGVSGPSTHFALEMLRASHSSQACSDLLYCLQSQTHKPRGFGATAKHAAGTDARPSASPSHVCHTSHGMALPNRQRQACLRQSFRSIPFCTALFLGHKEKTAKNRCDSDCMVWDVSCLDSSDRYNI